MVCSDTKWNKVFAATALIDCLPLAKIDSSHIISLRANLESKTTDVVVANLMHGESMMICPNISNFIPIWIVTKLIIVQSTYWNKWTAKTNENWAAIIKVHKKLGGTGNLTELRNFIADNDFKNSFCSNLKGELWTNMLSKAFSNAVVDSSRGKFQKMIKELRNKGWCDDVNFSDFKDWGHSLGIVLGVVGNPPKEDDLLKLLEESCKIPNGHDGTWSDRKGVLRYSGTAAKNFGAPILISRVLIDKVPKNWNSEWKIAIKTLAKKGETYDGKEHFNLLQQLLKKNKPIEAWNAGMTFCFWRYQQYKNVGVEAKLLMGKIAYEFFPEILWPIVSRNLGIDKI